jgi:hypothetical protein
VLIIEISLVAANNSKVALSRFIDNVAIQVIERHLMRDLGDIFSQMKVSDMSPEMILAIAGEDTEQQRKRNELEGKVESLEEGLKICTTSFYRQQGRKQGMKNHLLRK